jgi:hypothetical protein
VGKLKQHKRKSRGLGLERGGGCLRSAPRAVKYRKHLRKHDGLRLFEEYSWRTGKSYCDYYHEPDQRTRK